MDFASSSGPVVASEFKLLWTKTHNELGTTDPNHAQVEELFIHYLTGGENPDTTTLELTTDLSNNYMENGPILSSKKSMENGVKFSVDAENDVHLSISKQNPLPTSSWEIVLGGGNGGYSLIRRSHQGTNLAIVYHTKDQFKIWAESFELKMTETTVGLYDPEGKTIIEYTGFDSSDANFLYIATGFGSRGTWEIIIDESDPVVKPPKNPLDKLNKLVEKIEGFLNDNLSKHSSFIQSVNKKVGVITERMQSRYETLNEKCDFYEAPEEADDLRFDREDPCKAAVQLPKALAKWSATFNLHCKNSNTKFSEQRTKELTKITQKIQKKLTFC